MPISQSLLPQRTDTIYGSCGKMTFEFTCMPNGLSPAPRMFTKLLKPVFSTLRKLGHANVVYIDDSLLQGATVENCSLNVNDTACLLDSLGFTVHPEKSVFKPSQSITFLGFILNSLSMTIRLTEEKASKIKQ